MKNLGMVLLAALFGVLQSVHIESANAADEQVKCSRCERSACASETCPTSCTRNANAGASCPAQTCAPQKCTLQRCPNQTCAGQTCPAQTCASGTCLTKTCTQETCVSKECPTESCHRESCPSTKCTRCVDVEKTGLAPYIVAAPDVLKIKLLDGRVTSALKLQAGDAIQITATDTIRKRVIVCRTTVLSDGKIESGRIFQGFEAGGLTQEECAEAFGKYLNCLGIDSPNVTVTLVSARGIDGEHVVNVDGNINLGRFGLVLVSGKTIDEIKKAVEQKLAESIDHPSVDVGLHAQNSKVVYVIFEGMPTGDHVVRLPCDANMTVLDAIASTTLPQPIDVNKVRMSVSRVPCGDCTREIKLPIDLAAITKRGDDSTNHQLIPGDRVCIVADAVPEGYSPRIKYKLEQAVRRASHEAPSSPNAPDHPAQQAPRVRLEMTILEDTHGNLEEFEALKKGSMMFADSQAAMGTIRILDKNDLVRIMATPVLDCLSGRRVSMTIGQKNLEGSGKSTQSIEVGLTPVWVDDSTIRVALKTKIERQGQEDELVSEVLIDHRESIILRTSPLARQGASDTNTSPAVYVVLTPKTVR